MMKEKLLGALIGLARGTENIEYLITDTTIEVLAKGLVATLPDSDCSDEVMEEIYNQAMAEKQRLIPSCFTCTHPCGRTDNYDIQEFWDMDEEIRSLKLVLLSGAQNLARLQNRDEELNLYLFKALILFGIYWDVEGMRPILIELGNMMYKKIR